MDGVWGNQENGEKEGFGDPVSLHYKNRFLHTDVVYAGRPHTDPAHVDAVYIADMTHRHAHTCMDRFEGHSTHTNSTASATAQNLDRAEVIHHRTRLEME